MVSVGSPTLVRSLVLLGLYDELHLNINPVILGGGKPLFGPQERQSIKLVDTRQMAGGWRGFVLRQWESDAWRTAMQAISTGSPK